MAAKFRSPQHRAGRGRNRRAAVPAKPDWWRPPLPEASDRGRPLGIATKVNRKQDQRRVARHVRFFVLVPAQESKGEKEDVDAVLLLGRLRVTLHGMEPLMEKPGRQRCLQTVPFACPRED